MKRLHLVLRFACAISLAALVKPHEGRNAHCIVTLGVTMPKAEKPSTLAKLTIYFRPPFERVPACKFDKDALGNLPSAQWVEVTPAMATIAAKPGELVNFFCREE
jgi:hypothetical protein